jgi:hypothetical protein
MLYITFTTGCVQRIFCFLFRWKHFVIYRIDIAEAQRLAKSVPHCPLEVRASESDNAEGISYFSKNADKIKQDLLKHGAIWFRGFDLMKSVKGYREMYEALGLEPCLDPLHSSGLRKFASERDALYEEVCVSFIINYHHHHHHRRRRRR